MENRSVQYPSRYRRTQVPGMPGVFQITPEPGEIYAAGTPVNEEFFLSRLPLIIDNVQIEPAAWVRFYNADHEAAGFYYAATILIPNAGITAELIPDVVFNETDAMTRGLAPICDSSNSYITFYAKRALKTTVSACITFFKCANWWI